MYYFDAVSPLLLSCCRPSIIKYKYSCYTPTALVKSCPAGTQETQRATAKDVIYLDRVTVECSGVVGPNTNGAHVYYLSSLAWHFMQPGNADPEGYYTYDCCELQQPVAPPAPRASCDVSCWATIVSTVVTFLGIAVSLLQYWRLPIEANSRCSCCLCGATKRARSLRLTSPSLGAASDASAYAGSLAASDGTSATINAVSSDSRDIQPTSDANMNVQAPSSQQPTNGLKR